MDPLLTRLTGRAGALSRRTRVVLMTALAVVVLLIAAIVSGLGSAGDAAAVPVRATPAAAIPSASPTPVLVQVAGAVRRPGVVALPSGARVLDAIAAAGGVTAAGDDSAVPLAARVADGQRIDVPTRGSPSAAASGAPAGAPISLSAATEDQLETLPRIGPAMAARIIAWRAAHGGFTSVAQLQQVSGIGPRTFAGLKDLVTP